MDSSLSDHNGLMLTLLGEATSQPLTETYSLDYRGAIRHVQDRLDEGSDLNLSMIHGLLGDAVQIHTRVTDRNTTSTSGKRLQWLNDDLLREMAHRDWLNRRRKSTGLDRDEAQLRLNAYRRQRNKVTTMMRRARKEYVVNMIQEAGGDGNRLWRVVRYVLKNDMNDKRSELPSRLLLDSGEVIREPLAVAHELNRYFSEIAISLRTRLLDAYSHRPRMTTLTRSNDCSAYARPTSSDEITQILKTMNSKSAMGVDRISVKLMRGLGDSFVESVVPAINKSLKEGEFPNSFKISRVTPLFKGGAPDSPSNYRPISVIPNPSKLVENVIYNRIYQFVKYHNLIHEHQFGFQQGSSTTSAVLTLIHRCIDSIEAKRGTGLVFIDIQKAFDCVDHNLLLEKLEKLGIRGQLFTMIQDYLFGRRQRVQAGRHASDYLYVRYGVPQGSVLSTLLFILFINDIFLLPLKGYLQLFADDAALVYSAIDTEDLAAQIQHDLELLSNWFYNNLLSFNLSKTKFMIVQQIGLNVVNFPSVVVRGVEIERIHSYRYLGLIIDHRLKWTDHVAHVKSKIRPFLAVLRRCASLLPESSKLSLYYSAIHSHLLYLLSIWGTTALYRLQELERMQNKSLRFIFWRDYRFGGLSTNDLYKKYKILKLSDLVKYESIMTIFRVRAGILRTSVDFPLNSEMDVRTLRRQSFFHVPQSRTGYHLNSLAHRGISWFNDLDNATRRERNLTPFKRSLKDHFCNGY